MRWQLTQAKTAEWVIEQAKRQNRPIPPSLLDSPELNFGLQLYWDAFWDLHTCRPIGTAEGPISWVSIKEYAIIHGFGEEVEDTLFSHIRSMDGAYLEHRASQIGKSTAPPPKKPRAKK